MIHPESSPGGNGDCPPAEADTDRPNIAHVYDYLLGGSHNFAADRAFAEEFLARWPDARETMRVNRAFLARAVRFLAADAGIRQFLDIGSGPGNTQARLAEFTDACDVLGIHDHTIAWIDDDRARNPAAHLPNLVALIERGPGPSLAAPQPAAVFVPVGGYHPGRQAVRQAALATVCPGWSQKQSLPRLVLGYDGPEDRGWVTADGARPVLVGITGTTAVKGEALGCYASHVHEDPHPRSLQKIQAMDQAEGAALATQAAEGFAVYRMTF